MSFPVLLASRHGCKKRSTLACTRSFPIPKRMNDFLWLWKGRIQMLMQFWCVLRQCFTFLLSILQDLLRKSMISTTFPRLQSKTHRKIHCIWNVTHESFRFCSCFSCFDHVLVHIEKYNVPHVFTTFWCIAYSTSEFGWCIKSHQNNAAFGTFLMYLCDFIVFFTFWTRFGAPLMVSQNSVDV